jgi:hypothetical protein
VPQGNRAAPFGAKTALVIATLFGAAAMAPSAQAADDPPYTLAREGFFYVGGTLETANGQSHVINQMYVEFRIPAAQSIAIRS